MPLDVKNPIVLEDIKNGAQLRGVVPGQPVEVVSVEWIGDQAINLVYRVPGGGVAETTLYRDDQARIELDARGRAWFFDADGDLSYRLTEGMHRHAVHLHVPAGRRAALEEGLPARAGEPEIFIRQYHRLQLYVDAGGVVFPEVGLSLDEPKNLSYPTPFA